MKVKIVYYFFSYFSVALILALILVPLMRPLSFRVGAVDIGTGRRVHKGIVPRLGGIGIFIAFLVPAVFFLSRGPWDMTHYRLMGVLIASTGVFLIGVYDDIKGARIRYKLLVEILAAVFVYMWGVRIMGITNPLGGKIMLGWMSLPVTVLWVIIITNAVNLIDGLDGLAAGTGILIAATFFLLSGANIPLQLTYIILAGGLLGFLRYNFPPASVFMGDSGSLFLGFLLGATSILSSQKATAFITIMIPVIAFSFPLMDMFYAVFRRFYRGIPFGEADKEHIHHKLLERGLSKKKVLLFLYSINIVVMLYVLLLVGRQLNFGFFGLVLLVVFAVLGLKLLGYIEFIPFVKETIRGYDIGRKRKYFNYVIDRFRQNASGSVSLDDLRLHLTVLMREYNFNYAMIYLDMPNVKNPFYVFNDRPEPERPLTLSFPIMSSGNDYIGDFRICKQMDDDYFLCTAELVRALSEEVSKFVANKPSSLEYLTAGKSKIN